MIKNYNKNVLENDIPARTLISSLEKKEETFRLSDSYIYHNFPLYVGYDENKILTNVLLLSKKYGIFVFQCISEYELEELNERQENLEQIYSQVLSKLIKSKKLRKGFDKLIVNIVPIVFLSFTGKLNESAEKLWGSLEVKGIRNEAELEQLFEDTEDSNLSEPVLDEIRSILEGSKVITKERAFTKADVTKRKGEILTKIESRIALFDAEQRSASFFIHDKPQRIRGLAGSGKTIILAMKAAQIHLNQPNAKVLYTFYTKSLHDLIKRLITRFYRQYSDKDPNWENIRIMHAWGGRNLEGVYYNTCRLNGTTPITLSEAGGIKNKFQHVCGDIVNRNLTKEYDYALLDEAQDFPTNFYKLCRKITKNDKIIWAYDEFQNVIDIELQNTKNTFGPDENGIYIDLTGDADQDIILHKCYRNDRKILFLAFALGLGIYNDKIIQMPENNSHWEDLGFVVREGNSNAGDLMIIERPEENSPIETKDDDTVRVGTFKGNDINEECEFVVSRIADDIKNGLPPEEILVISLDDRNSKTYFNLLTRLVSSKLSIQTFNLFDASYSNKIFKRDNCITLSSVYKAKGNEAGSVYVLGTDSVFLTKDSIIERNKLFTAITRAKLWVTVTGTGDSMKNCVDEIKSALGTFPVLKFAMPDKKSLKTIQRDLGYKMGLVKRFKNLMDDAEKEGIDPQEIIRSRKTDKLL